MSVKDFAAAIGQQIRVSRREAGLSQTQVAQRFGWGQNLVSRHETGKYMVSYRQLHQYAELFDWSMDLVNEFLRQDPRGARRAVVRQARSEYQDLADAVRPLLFNKDEQRRVHSLLADVVRDRYKLSKGEMIETTESRGR